MPQLTNLRLLVPCLSPFRPSSSLPLFTLCPKPITHSLFTVLASSSSRKNRNFPSENLELSRGNRTTVEKDRRPPMKDSETLNFNKRRAEGRDGNGVPKKLPEPKSRKLNPVNTIAYVQILGTGMDTQDTSPSVLLFFDNLRFIFNAGEGLQRFCTEHKIKLSKVDYIFLSRVCSETAGGLPGLLLTLAGIGDEGLSVNVCGPSDIKHLVNAMKSFIPNAAMVYTKSFDSPLSIPIDNEIVKISAILLQPRHSNEHQHMDEEHLKTYLGDRTNDGPGQNSPNSKVCTIENLADASVVYVCELPDIQGKFHPDRARALGLKAGPKYRELQLGLSVMSDSGDKMVHPSDVMDPPIPGPIVILVDCPTESHLEALLSVQSLNDYYRDCIDNPATKTVTCIIHLSPRSMVRNSKYQKWIKRFGSTQHILAGHDKKNIEIPILKSSARVAARLNFLCPQLFPAPGFWSLSNDKYLGLDSTTLGEGSVSELHSSISVDNLLKFTLRPHAHLGLDRSCIPSTMTQSEIISELLSEIPETVEAAKQLKGLWQFPRRTNEDVPTNEKLMVEEPWLCPHSLPNCLEDIRRDDLEIVLLGTGSSQPSKYRNVSSIYFNLFSKGSLLLDCGEGTLGQLKRRYGLEGADNAVRSLKCIWISHIHADHHTGLARILTLRRDLQKGVPHEPLLVVGPRQLKRYLDAYQGLEDLDMQFLDCKHTTEFSLEAFENDESHRSSSPGSNQDINNEVTDDCNLFSRGSPMQSYWKWPGSPPDRSVVIPILRNFKKIIREASLDALVSVPVVHCPQAYGVVIKAADRTNNTGKVIPGWKIVYSGDTRPCPELVEASRDATVLIHEATFEDGMLEEAIARNHSTTKEAVEVGDSAGAYRIILTHFSQRYPKIPVFDETHMHKTCIAFDMMSINVADLPQLPKVLPYLKLLFRNEMILEESEDIVSAVSVAS